ncbi:MAG: SAM-dependent chlorinase/fluorinase [Bacteroidota bacterium]
MKAQLLQINPAFTIVDISHSISPFNYPQAAYICRSAFKSFPAFSYHIILVNLFEKKTGTTAAGLSPKPIPALRRQRSAEYDPRRKT